MGAFYFQGKGETFEVALFIHLGMSPGQALAFCRHLDDNRPVGISSTFLAERVVKCVALECKVAQRDGYELGQTVSVATRAQDEQTEFPF